MNRRIITPLAIVAVLAGAAWFAWQAAAPEKVAVVKGEPTKKPAPMPKPAPVKPNGWVPPEGDPVEKFHTGKTAAERKEIMQNFLTLGHPNNRFMLIAALADSDPSVRFMAVESCAMLTPEEAREVYARSVLSPDKDVREMTWSLVAPHPIENRSMVYGEAIEKGGNAQMEEALSEMGRTPEKPLFEMMLIRASATKEPERAARLLREAKTWLQPGGGNVPLFKTLPELVDWWTKQTKNYDQFMLRVDQ